MQDKLAKLEGLRDVTTNLDFNPQMKVEIDREKAAVYGITMDQIRQELFNAFGSRPISTIYTPSNSYQVILETLPELQSNTTDLSRLRLKTASGQTVPLEAVARLVPTVGLLQVHHLGQRPAVTISFNLAPGYSLGHALDAIQKVERELPLPVTVSSSFQGAAQVFSDSLKGMPLLILAAIFATYVMLGILYESFVHPITIISGLPSAGHRRADHADGLQHGVHRDRHHRHDHADRHRQEERHHDGRLRDRAPPRRACPRTTRSARRACCASARS